MLGGSRAQINGNNFEILYIFRISYEKSSFTKMKQVNLFAWILPFFIEASDAQLKICWRIIISFVVLALFIDQTLWHFLYAKVAKVAEREYNSH